MQLLSSSLLVVFGLLVLWFGEPVIAHGALTGPPSRNSQTTSWDYNGVEWNAGSAGTNAGFIGDWNNPQVTSVCGSPAWDTPGPITATYTAGQVASFEVTITAAHMGFYEFRLCPRAPSTKSELVQCFLSRPPLKRQTPLAPGEKARYVEGGPAQWPQEELETRWRAPSLNAANAGDLYAQDGHPVAGKTVKGYPVFSLNYIIPSDVQCDHCVLNWYYQTTNSATNDADTLATIQGERFWNCADIRITSAGQNSTAPTQPVVPPTTTPATTPATATATAPSTPATTPSTPVATATSGSTSRCGISWAQANGDCGTSCHTNTDCPSGHVCFGNLSATPCQTPHEHQF